MEPQSPVTSQGGGKRRERRFRKREGLYYIINRIKLLPSRNGILHGVRSVKLRGNVMTIITHCNQQVCVKCSKSGRLARWLRNKWYERSCQGCRVPKWKLEKYSQTSFVKQGKHERYLFSYSKTATS